MHAFRKLSVMVNNFLKKERDFILTQCDIVLKAWASLVV